MHGSATPGRIELVEIPRGVIAMRDDRTGRRWTATITPFLMARFPITQAQYQAVTGKSPSGFKGPNHPVESVSWLDAVDFCNQLSELEGLVAAYKIGEDTATRRPSSQGYRLPEESEWEFACRAGTDGPRYGELQDIAWYQGNAAGQHHPVGGKLANAWGLYDMLGNVWEWCEDLYDRDVYGAYRVFRGGGWSDPERHCLATNRRRSHPTFAIDDLGFRVARSFSQSQGPDQ